MGERSYASTRHEMRSLFPIVIPVRTSVAMTMEHGADTWRHLKQEAHLIPTPLFMSFIGQ